MHKVCICVGIRQNCSRGKQCQLVLPTMTEVAVKLKKLYEQSVYSMIRNSSVLYEQSVYSIIRNSLRPLIIIIIYLPRPPIIIIIIIVNRETSQRVLPSKMIHFNISPDYCMANSDYNITGIEGRECTLKNKLSSQHCDNLCCDHGYENVTVSEKGSCNCKFVWCCRVECDTCNITRIIHRCKAEPETSSTSNIGYDLYYG